MKKLFIFCLALCASSIWAASPAPSHLKPSKTSWMAERKTSLIPVKFSAEFLDMERLRSLQLNHQVPRSAADNLPSEVNLSMNGVPVLDQGKYPTCVTFAVTAAVDAALNEGDYISQLCLIQLSNTLAENSFWHSLWAGSSIRVLMDYLSHYGIITIEDQKKGICNSVKTYPIEFDKRYLKHKMSVAGYHAHSEDIIHQRLIEPQVLFIFAHINLLDTNPDSNPDRVVTLGNNTDSWITPENAFAAVRKSLAEGNRVIIEFIFNGILERGGMIHEDNDTWFAGRELKSAFSSLKYITDSPSWFIHDVVLYGYNDKMAVKNTKGESQTGVFYVRNSWGEEKLEYMTYDFFKLMAVEGTSINAAKKPH